MYYRLISQLGLYITRLIFFGPFFRDKLSFLHFFIYSIISLKNRVCKLLIAELFLSRI